MHLILLRLRLFFHQLVPLLILLLCDILDRTHVFRFLPIEPLLTLPLIYHWAVYKPELLSVFTLFVVGIVDDAIGGALLGQTSLMFLILYALVLLQKHHIKEANFSGLWWGFAFYMLCAVFLEWAISSMLYDRAICSWIFLLQNAVMVVLYPLIHGLLVKLEKTE
jgi:rod shape-determining protein MreD